MSITYIASAALKAVTIGQLTEKERLVLSSSQHSAELLNEINVIEEAETSELQSSANEENSALQNSSQNGIINESSDNATITAPKYSEEQHRAAILRYKSGEAYTINAKLREGVGLDIDDQEFVDVLNEGLQQLPTYEGTVYRNLVFDDFGGKEALDEFLKQHVPNNIIIYEQFISCSTKIDGYPVEGNFKVHLIIDSKTARNLDGYGNNMESEVLYGTDSVFIVEKILTEENIPTIYLKEAQANGYNTIKEQSDAVFNLQESYSRDGDLQGVPASNTVGDFDGQVRPQSTSSAGQRNNVRSNGGQGSVLSAESQEQISKQADSENGPASFMPENG